MIIVRNAVEFPPPELSAQVRKRNKGMPLLPQLGRDGKIEWVPPDKRITLCESPAGPVLDCGSNRVPPFPPKTSQPVSVVEGGA